MHYNSVHKIGAWEVKILFSKKFFDLGFHGIYENNLKYILEPDIFIK